MNRNLTVTMKTLILMVASSLLPTAPASDDHVAPEEFLAEVFGKQLPASETVWLTGEKKDVAESILGHKPDYLRLRFWGDHHRSAWIVNEIGKTEPITIGVVVKENRIEDIKVLAFRESRGWEIKYDYFTRQFNGASIANRHRLDRPIDGISGATLSVKAMTNVSRLVLYLAESGTS